MNTPYSVVDLAGNILRSGTCAVRDFYLQASAPEEEVVLGRGSDIDDKVETDAQGHRVIVQRDKADRDARRAAQQSPGPTVPHGDQMARITNDQLDAIMARLAALEAIAAQP